MGPILLRGFVFGRWRPSWQLAGRYLLADCLNRQLAVLGCRGPSMPYTQEAQLSERGGCALPARDSPAPVEIPPGTVPRVKASAPLWKRGPFALPPPSPATTRDVLTTRFHHPADARPAAEKGERRKWRGEFLGDVGGAAGPPNLEYGAFRRFPMRWESGVDWRAQAPTRHDLRWHFAHPRLFPQGVAPLNS
jgi:hypothetical protein